MLQIERADARESKCELVIMRNWKDKCDSIPMLYQLVGGGYFAHQQTINQRIAFAKLVPHVPNSNEFNISKVRKMIQKQIS